MIEILDEVYGPITVVDQLLVDLINSEGVRRLEGVSQAGASRFVHAGRTVSRFEHCIGVMHLTGVLGGDRVERAAGLLQDVSHTAFSHTVDYVVGDKAESFHEQVYLESVLKTDIPLVLEKHGLRIEDVTAAEVLGRRIDIRAPDVCVDRIDYTLRDLRRFGRLTPIETQIAVDHLIYKDGKVAFDSGEVAAEFVAWYHYLVTELFMNPLELYAHEEFAEILRDAITVGELSIDELISGQDEKVLTGVRSGSFAERFDRLCEVTDVEVDPSDGVGRRVSGKIRTIDPLVWEPSHPLPVRLSELRPKTLRIWDDIRNIGDVGMVVRPRN